MTVIIGDCVMVISYWHHLARAFFLMEFLSRSFFPTAKSRRQQCLYFFQEDRLGFVCVSILQSISLVHTFRQQMKTVTVDKFCFIVPSQNYVKFKLQTSYPPHKKCFIVFFVLESSLREHQRKKRRV